MPGDHFGGSPFLVLDSQSRRHPQDLTGARRAPEAAIRSC
jgi:hypothetical protein